MRRGFEMKLQFSPVRGADGTSWAICNFPIAVLVQPSDYYLVIDHVARTLTITKTHAALAREAAEDAARAEKDAHG